jgi:hypothetical protein
MIQLPPIRVWEALILLNLLEKEIKRCRRDETDKEQALTALKNAIQGQIGPPPFRSFKTQM